jgi:Tol biopolymer transport system component
LVAGEKEILVSLEVFDSILASVDGHLKQDRRDTYCTGSLHHLGSKVNNVSGKGDYQIMFKKTPNQMLARRLAGPTQTSRANSTGRGVPRARLHVFISIAVALTFTALVSAQHFGDWVAPVNVESIPGTSSELNTASNEGYPILSPDGLSLYVVSDRVGLGMLDIWVARRGSADDPWGAPENLGLPVNSSGNDHSPTPVPGQGLFFVSSRPGSCGATPNDDIYFTRFKNGAWEEPQNVGCQINSTVGEASPSYFEDESGHCILYFSSNRTGGLGMQDIYFSVDFGPAQLVPGLNTALNDVRPNIRKDGLEIVFDSTRSGSLGMDDIWTATRETTADDWSTPTHLDPPINSAARETRATLSRDGLTMFFSSNRPGSELAPSGQPSSDIYMTTREKLKGNER